MSADKRDQPRAGTKPGHVPRKPDARDCVQQTADGQIQWRATEKSYPHGGDLRDARS